MNLFSSMLRLFGIGALSNNDTGAQVGSVGDISTDAGITVTDERAMQVSAVWACVQYITNSVCSLPIEFYRKTDDGRDKRKAAFKDCRAEMESREAGDGIKADGCQKQAQQAGDEGFDLRFTAQGRHRC